MPQIYYGDEIGMRGGQDPDNRRDFPGGWPDDPRTAFEPSGRTPEEEMVFSHARKVARLRARLEPLRRGKMVQLAVEDQIYVFARMSQKGIALVAFNNGNEQAKIEFVVPRLVAPALSRTNVLKDRLGSPADLLLAGGKARCTLPARSAAIYAE